MALTTTTFQCISNSGARRVFLYQTADNIAACDNADYFFTAGTAPANGEDIRDSIQQWDIIIHIDTGNSLIGFLLVSASTSSTITTVPLDLA